jgi:hypothetical protein
VSKATQVQDRILPENRLKPLKTVSVPAAPVDTPLKEGVNEKELFPDISLRIYAF